MSSPDINLYSPAAVPIPMPVAHLFERVKRWRASLRTVLLHGCTTSCLQSTEQQGFMHAHMRALQGNCLQRSRVLRHTRDPQSPTVCLIHPLLLKLVSHELASHGAHLLTFMRLIRLRPMSLRVCMWRWPPQHLWLQLHILHAAQGNEAGGFSLSAREQTHLRNRHGGACTSMQDVLTTHHCQCLQQQQGLPTQPQQMNESTESLVARRTGHPAGQGLAPVGLLGATSSPH